MNRRRTFRAVFSVLIAVYTLQAARGAKQEPPGNPEPLPEQEAPLMGRPFAAEPRDIEPIAGIVLVKLRPNTEKEIGYGSARPGPARASSFGIAGLDATLRRFQVRSVERTLPNKTVPPPYPLPDLSKLYTLHLSNDTEAELLVAALNQNAYVEYAEQIYPSFVDVTPNDALYSVQTHFARINADSAWSIQTGDSSIILAIIDTGVDWDHEDLVGNIWQNLGEDADGDGHTIEWQDTVWVLDPGDLNNIDDDGNGFIDDLIGWDFVDADSTDVWPGEDYGPPDNDPNDFYGHGTHVSGIAAAVTDNTIGVAGTSWNTTIMAIRYGYETPDGKDELPWPYPGLEYAADNGADIISLSWGGGSASSAAQDIIDYAWGMGSIIVAAAGNDGSAAYHYPSAYNHVLAVGSSSTTNDRLSYFSNYGTWIDIFAPGSGILSTLPDDSYGRYSGTSMACPMVAGGVALLKAQFPVLSNHEILMRLVAGADNIDSANTDLVGLLGFGRMNLYQALTGTTGIGPNIDAYLVFSDTTFGNGDGILDPGETIQCYANLENRLLGGESANLTLILSTSDYALSITSSQANVAALQPLTGVSTMAFAFKIATTAIAHRATFTLDVSGDDGYQESFSFSAIIGRASILLVDDDDSGNNVEGYYFKSLDSLGVAFEYWSHMEQGTPVGILDQFSTVIWLTEWAFPALDSADRVELGAYLDGGGKLFLSGQDIGWSLCEDSPVENEFSRSGGASRDWYETYLHARYLADDATPNGASSVNLSGVSANAIGNGLSFDIHQPGRDAANQYPSVIDTLGGSEAIFQYPDGSYSATAWTGDYSIVNFAFGYEAITDNAARFIVMNRVLGYLNGFAIDHDPLVDTEDTVKVYPVSVMVTTAVAQLDSIAIYWSLDGNIPFNIEPMSIALGLSYGTDADTTFTFYEGSIPAQSAGSTVYYFIFADTPDGYIQTSPIGAPGATHTFYVNPVAEVLPERYALLQNYPNPFNPVTTIEYHLLRSGEVSLRLYNLRGQLVRTLIDDFRPAGVRTVALNGDGLASGVYLYRLEAGDFTRTRKMILLK